MTNGDKTEKLEVKEGEKKEQEKQTVQKIELTPEQYNALLDEVAELEALKAARRSKKEEEEEEFDVDKLAKEGKTKGRVKEEEEEEQALDFDNMTNTQLVKVILKEIDKHNEERLNPLEVTVETLRMLREIDKAESKHEDFWTYGDQVQKMCIANPNLGVEDAYILAKSKAQPAKGKEKGEEEKVQTKTERLLKLPPRTHGDKSSVAASSTSAIEKGKTLKGAAERAFDEIFKDRTSI